jgi:hypothetical protein
VTGMEGSDDLCARRDRRAGGRARPRRQRATRPSGSGTGPRTRARPRGRRARGQARRAVRPGREAQHVRGARCGRRFRRGPGGRSQQGAGAAFSAKSRAWSATAAPSPP